MDRDLTPYTCNHEMGQDRDRDEDGHVEAECHATLKIGGQTPQVPATMHAISLYFLY